MRIAFYAPLKAPDHETPSGDRRVAALYAQALEANDFTVTRQFGIGSIPSHIDADVLGFDPTQPRERLDEGPHICHACRIRGGGVH